MGGEGSSGPGETRPWRHAAVARSRPPRRGARAHSPRDGCRRRPGVLRRARRVPRRRRERRSVAVLQHCPQLPAAAPASTPRAARLQPGRRRDSLHHARRQQAASRLRGVVDPGRR